MEEFTQLVDLASARVGGKALAASDDFFAPKANLLKVAKAVFIADKFTPRGKWMDGWESRRKRTPGHDWCVVKLGLRGIVRGVNVDTSFFIGNYPEHCSVDALDAGRETQDARRLQSAHWTEILPKSPLGPGKDNLFKVTSDKPWTHLRLNIYPDGGVARLRVYGDVLVDWKALAQSKKPVDLAAIENGGRPLVASDEHFGRKENLLMPGRAPNMGDGWETRRRRGPGFDWVVVKLGGAGRIERIEVDTNHFKGNYPDAASIEGCFAPLGELPNGSWTEILARTKLKAHHRHFFAKELKGVGPYTHVRLNIYPDGGVSRLRLIGVRSLA